jgi:general L-amino acid transport system permease protein
MAASTKVSDNRPPPDRRQALTLFTPGIPWYRDIKVLRVLAQLIFVILFVGFAYLLFSNLVRNLTSSNLSLDFGVFRRPFNVAVNEGLSLTEAWTWAQNTEQIGWGLWLVLVAGLAWSGWTVFSQFRRKHLTLLPVLITLVLLSLVVTSPPAALASWAGTVLTDYFYPSSMARAFVTGIYNTLQVVLFSLVGSTMLGIFVGIGLLSRNFIVRNISRIYVEIFRNTPLVVQLIFLYRTLTLILPPPRQSIFGPQVGDTANLWIFNARGLYFPRPVITETTHLLYIALGIGLVILLGVRAWRNRVHEQSGQPTFIGRYALGILLGALVIGWVISGTPYTINYPFLRGPNVQEGMQLTISLVALFLGLTLYTAAFIADIVRAGIQSVPYGQIEAARSQGFTGGQVLSMVVLPQALRLIIPPLGNQYVNLGKNSSLALVVGYVDTYRIAQIANNESGQAVPFFALLMLTYLAISLTLSYLTNLMNRSTQLKTR